MVQFRRRSTVLVVAAGAALLTLGVAAPAHAAPTPVKFAPAAHYPTGANGAGGWSETSLVTADFNGDGRKDIVGTDYFNGKAPLLQLNLGGGTFKTPGTRLPAAADGVGALAAGDVNNDSKPDLLLSNTRNVLVFKGNGDGTFTPGASYAIFSGGQEDIVIADVNNDGMKDAAVVTRTGFQMMMGKGDGTFTLPAAASVPGVFPSGIDDAKFNYDASPDLLLIDGAGQVVPMLGKGDGTFTRGTPGAAGFILGTGLAGDFNHDGIDDAVSLPEFNLGIRNAVVFISDGKGGFTGSGTYYDGGLAPVSGELADLNSDGHLDIIAADTGGGQEVVLLGNGDGTFVQGGKFAVSASTQTPVVGDFDLDGKTDIAGVGIQNRTAATLSVLRNIS
jgi:hypothetical protein